MRVIIEGYRWIMVLLIVVLIGAVGYQIGEGNKFSVTDIPVVEITDMALQGLSDRIRDTIKIYNFATGNDITVTEV